MLKVAVSGGKDMDESLNYAPNPDQLVGQDGQGESDDDGPGGSTSKDGIYRAPRLASVPYEEEEREAAKKAKKDERNRKRMQKSTILSELREEFSERPTEILASGSSALDKEIAREESEKKDFEESRFVRLVTSRKDKIRKRQREQEASRADNVGSIDNFAGVQDILSLDKSKHRIPIARETAKIGGKVGGIFSHIEVPVSFLFFIFITSWVLLLFISVELMIIFCVIYLFIRPRRSERSREAAAMERHRRRRLLRFQMETTTQLVRTRLRRRPRKRRKWSFRISSREAAGLPQTPKLYRQSVFHNLLPIYILVLGNNETNPIYSINDPLQATTSGGAYSWGSNVYGRPQLRFGRKASIVDPNL